MITGKNIYYTIERGKEKKVILDGISFEFTPGRITALIGESGAGKTTLLKCAAQLVAEYEGKILLGEQNLKDLSPRERAFHVGFVFQQFHLFPHLNVLQNCIYALKQGARKEEKDRLVIEVLTSLGMLPWIEAFPSQLSGGQQQKVAIARALVLQPQILFLDEPTSGLDPLSRTNLESILLNLQAKGLTLVFSSHDTAFIERMADRIYYLEEGKVAEEWDREKGEIILKGKIETFIGGPTKT